MNHLIIRKIFILSLIFISGCQKISSKSEQASKPVNAATSSTASGECPEQPNVVLNTQNVKAIALKDRQASISGIAKRNQSLGYTFEAKSGQNFNYQTEEDICVWIYTPDNQLLNSKKLPVNGKYTIQVSAPKGSATFDLEIGLNSLQTSSSIDKTTSQANSSPSKQSQNSERRSAADTFVRQYYQDINNRNYQSSWNKLSPDFKRQTSGYFDYQQWWNTVSKVRIGEINLINQSQNTAVVNAELVYVMNTGKYFKDRKNRIYLVWDSSSNNWLFEDKR